MSTIQASSKSPDATAALPEDGDVVWSVVDLVPAWGLSALVHAALILIIAMISLPEILKPEFNLTSAIEPEEIRQVEYLIDSVPAETLGNGSNLNIQGASVAAAQHRGLDNHREKVQQIEQNIVNPRIALNDAMSSPNEAEMLSPIDLTGTTEHAGGTDGAVDRITLEIASSLRQRKTLPVWIFDESGSMETRRDRIVERFETIYRQLGLMDDLDTRAALQTGLIGFGKDVHVLLEEPTNDIETLVSAVKTLTLDESGAENVFAALTKAIKVYGPVRKKLKANMMIIIVTDERGDDFGNDYSVLEDVVKRCARDGIRVYCIGNTSVFGRQKGQVYHKWEADGEPFEGFIEVDQGPESPLPEGLQLPYWAASASGLEQMSSGYGPYTLSRLCAETGGIFFIADDTARMKWDAQIMRQYAPDYRPGIEYRRQLQGNLAKQSLIAAAQLAVTEPVPIPQRSFQANNDNILREQITEAQKPLAVLDYFLERVQTALEAGEKHRDKLDSDRWRASYDLAMGRVLAMRVRAFGYNAILAEMKSSPKKFENSGSNQWVLNPSEEINAGANVRRMNDKALEYLNRVVDEHPGTPWAFLAKIELSEPLGWEWKEHTMQVAAMVVEVDRNSPQFLAEEERRQQQRERQRKMEDSKPKL